MCAPIEETPSRFILTGPPGAGKTSILEALPKAVSTIPEAARRVLAEERRTGGRATGEQNPDLFVQRMLALGVADFDGAEGTVIFDRGLPDLIGFCVHYGLPKTAILAALKDRQYRRRVFFCPPWKEIYRKDDERTLDFAGAAAFGELVRRAYSDCGYDLIQVPRGRIEDRVQFILDQMTL